MLNVNNVSLSFGSQKLFDDVNVSFFPGNCYVVIGANGAGKSTFLKLLSGEKDADTGEITKDKNARMSILKQDHFQYDDEVVIDTVIMGNKRLYDIMQEKDAIYAKPDLSDEDGIKVSELEAEFAELNGWDADSEAATMLQGLGIDMSKHNLQMKELTGSDKVKVLLAQALFGNPEILLLDEPTNNLDIQAIKWLQNFLDSFDGAVIVVSHDRYFLNEVCTHMLDIDFNKIKLYPGNYDFWYESSQLALQMSRDQNKKKEDKIKDLQAFIAKFSANKSKSRQATSRKKLLEKITLDDISPSTRRYPFVGFTIEREVGNEILTVENINKESNGETILKDISFRVNKGDKIAFIGDELAITSLFEIINEKDQDFTGEYKWGQTITTSYFPKDNSEFFENSQYNLIDWLRQYSVEQSEIYIRGLLGRMLFSGEEALKNVSVLSGGEKVRCMFSKMMVNESNVLVLDQPTNHLDLESITSVNNGLISFKSNILFTSFDHQFINTIANRIIEVFEDGTIRDISMTYEDYLEKYYN
ncbi:MAG: ABC-F family ATP-binding cassette domain-containing protein [Tissierellia bacterium]|nr:ABC-F family ATP-binding cassette domain-containing protein [Tissierellia bacterium]